MWWVWTRQLLSSVDDDGDGEILFTHMYDDWLTCLVAVKSLQSLSNNNTINACNDRWRTDCFRSISSSGAFPPYPAAGLVFIVRDQLNWNWILAEIVQISSTKQKFPPQNRRVKCGHWSDITIIITVIVIVILRTPIAVPCSIIKYRSNTLRKPLSHHLSHF